MTVYVHVLVGTAETATSLTAMAARGEKTLPHSLKKRVTQQPLFRKAFGGIRAGSRP